MKTSTILLAACGLLVALPACKKKEKDDDSADTAVAAPAPPPPAPEPVPAPAAAPDPNAAAQPAPGTPAPGTDAAAPTGKEVKRYPNETPVGNATVRAVVPFNVYREADLQSEKLAGIAQGTFVNVKSTYQNWILVEYPSGVGEMSPGWAPIPNINDRRIALATREEALRDPRWNGGRPSNEPIERPDRKDRKVVRPRRERENR
jgi:hypothetical protein